MSSKDIRQKFLDFFRDKGHTIVPSSSLIPDDPTTLFTTAGMQPMVPYLLGQKHPGGTRIVDSQRSFRAQDIEEVGDNRHTTFFEMLGNWSFGDYFKKEQLSWVFEFITKEVGLDPKRIYVSVFAGNDQVPRDSESVQLWKGLFASVGIEAKDVEHAARDGMQGGRIFYYGEEKNWWSRSGAPVNMPAGEPGGPDSEMFFEFADIAHDPVFGEHCHPNCDCGRYLEIGNSVFMEYMKQEDGTFAPLPAKNVDFGGGLERMTAASINSPDVFKIDLFKPIIEKLEALTGKKYDADNARSMRIIGDHLKAAIMLIADGVVPSNKAQGYVLRRLIRRSVRFANLLGVPKPFTESIVPIIIGIYESVVPGLHEKQEYSIRTIMEEEEKFNKTIERGLKEIEKLPLLDGATAFRLYESYGFPFELTEEIARERGQNVAYGEFRKAFEKHQEVSRAGMEKKFGGHGLILDTGELKAGSEEELKKVTRLHTATHLLQQALRDVLGNEVQQRGSDITTERTRFDFVFGRKMTDEEKKKVEEIVNKKVAEALPVNFVELPLEEAVATGALHFFKTKYPAQVKVYFVGHDVKSAYSKEFCGGPHVKNTSEIGRIKIAKEEASSAGVRRIRATVE
jgi:alanyl-tRNA synthetase